MLVSIDVNALDRDMKMDLFYFVSNMTSPKRKWRHAACNQQCCHHDQIDSKTYQTRHLSDDCQRPNFNADQDEILKILSTEATPLILVESDGRITVARSDQRERYVAVTHVWSDGLGNAEANSLPSCQVLRLGNLVADLYDSPTSFWLDTLYCPVTPGPAKTLALTEMPRTYREADKVLVFHSYMLSLELKSRSNLDAVLRVICSNWTRRLWTLQESILASKVFVQFADGAMDLDGALTELERARRGTPEKDIRASAKVLRRSPLAKSSSKTHGRFLITFSMSLEHRAVTVPSDEPLCLETILGGNIKSIVKAAPTDRMRAFWGLRTEYLANICLWDGPRLESPKGYRWAPSTFLRASSQFMVSSTYSSAPAHRTESGLAISCCYQFLRLKTDFLRNKFYLRDEDHKWWRVNVKSAPVIQAVEQDIKHLHIKSNCGARYLAILHVSPDPICEEGYGLLVAVDDVQHGTYYTRLQQPVKITLISAGHSRWHFDINKVNAIIEQCNMLYTATSDLIYLLCRTHH